SSNGRVSRLLLWAGSLVVIAFLCLPALFVIPVSFTAGSFIEFPPQGFSLRWYGTYWNSPGWIDATLRSLIVAVATACLATVLCTVMAVLRTDGERVDQAARILGASAWRTLYYITLPQIRPGIIAAFLFAFITSFDDLTIALFVSGGRTATLPRQMWNDLLLQVNPTLAAVATVILLFVTVFI